MTSENGFTLIELLVVVLIIGILASIVVPNYRSAMIKSKLSATMLQMKYVTDANVDYKLDHDTFLPFLNTDSDYVRNFYRLTTPVNYAENFNIFTDTFFKHKYIKDEVNYDKTFDYIFSTKERFYLTDVLWNRTIKADMMILESVGVYEIDSIILDSKHWSEKDIFNCDQRTNGKINKVDI